MTVITCRILSFLNLDKHPVVIPIGTEIKVDAEENIGYYNGLHFHIDKSEYVAFDTDDMTNFSLS